MAHGCEGGGIVQRPSKQEAGVVGAAAVAARLPSIKLCSRKEPSADVP